MSKLKSSTSLASYAQKNPFQVYVEKGAEHFTDLLSRIAHNSVKSLFTNRFAVKTKAPTEVMVEKYIEEKIKAEKEHEKELKSEVAQQEPIHPNEIQNDAELEQPVHKHDDTKK